MVATELSNIGSGKEIWITGLGSIRSIVIVYGVYSDVEIDTNHLETKLIIINFTRLELLSRTLKLTNQITVKKFFWIPATIFWNTLSDHFNYAGC